MAGSLRASGDKRVAFLRHLDDTSSARAPPPSGHANAAPGVYDARPSFHPDQGMDSSTIGSNADVQLP
ncbi:MAG: hypothetical protein KA144_10050, partial [Xanthomonadaceae bacterium]|nr:hypothetical protein [Xanthomonadaceae bacterium]